MSAAVQYESRQKFGSNLPVFGCSLAVTERGEAITVTEVREIRR